MSIALYNLTGTMLNRSIVHWVKSVSRSERSQSFRISHSSLRERFHEESHIVIDILTCRQLISVSKMTFFLLSGITVCPKGSLTGVLN